jgi:hypothetical protein
VVVPWQVITGIVGPSLAMVGIGGSMLRMPALPAFGAARVWFYAAAAWTMITSAIGFSATSRSAPYVAFLVTVELATIILLVKGLRWISSRELLHLEHTPSMASVAEIELQEERNRLNQEHLKLDVEDSAEALRKRKEDRFFQAFGRYAEESVNPRIHLHTDPRKPDAPEVVAPQDELGDDK